MSPPSETARTGRYVRQPGGFRAFYPSELPFAPPVRYDAELRYILSRADQAIGRLDSSADMIPNPDMFVRMYVQKEAIQTSQLEGVTQASLSQFLEQEAIQENKTSADERAEVRNYVLATNYALERLGSLPLSLNWSKRLTGYCFRGFGAASLPPDSSGQGKTGLAVRVATSIPPISSRRPPT